MIAIKKNVRVFFISTHLDACLFIVVLAQRQLHLLIVVAIYEVNAEINNVSARP